MRVILLLSLFCVVVSGQTATITRQGYVNGTVGPSGCGTVKVNDTQTYQFGVCVNTTEPTDTTLTSIIFNDCSANGEITVSRFNGSATCDPVYVLDLHDLKSTLVGTSGSYCNIEADGAYATYSCSSVYPTNSPTTVNVKAYPFIPPIFTANDRNNNCNESLTPAGTAPFEFPAGVCKQVPTTTYAILANCVNNLVTAVFYDSSNCAITWNATSNTITNVIIPIGPYAQTGATSAIGKLPATPGSTCGLVPNFSFMNFTCVTAPTPTTAAPTTLAPTTPSTSSSSSSSTGGSVNNHASTIMYSMAALVVPILAIIFA